MTDSNSTLPEHQGTLKFYDPEKRFGFIEPNDPNHDDVFFHQSALDAASITPPMPEGATIRYDIGTNPRTGRPCAVNLVLLDT